MAEDGMHHEISPTVSVQVIEGSHFERGCAAYEGKVVDGVATNRAVAVGVQEQPRCGDDGAAKNRACPRPSNPRLRRMFPLHHCSLGRLGRFGARLGNDGSWAMPVFDRAITRLVLRPPCLEFGGICVDAAAPVVLVTVNWETFLVFPPLNRTDVSMEEGG